MPLGLCCWLVLGGRRFLTSEVPLYVPEQSTHPHMNRGASFIRNDSVKRFGGTRVLNLKHVQPDVSREPYWI